MSGTVPERLPEDVEHGTAALDARLVATACRSMLALPVFEHSFAIQMLAKMAADEKLPPRERTNCLRTLASVQMKLLETLALAEGAQATRVAASAAVAVSQVEQTVRVEIVRGRDWRDAVVEAQAPVSPEPPPLTDGTGGAT